LRRITKATLGGLAGCALVLGGTQVASGALSGTYKFTEGLADLLTDDWSGERPFDSTRAKTTIVKTSDGGTTFTLRVTGIDPSSPVPDGGFGAHLHVGPCEASVGHYKNDPSILTAIRENEVWFDLVPDEEGMAYNQQSVPFVPVDEDGDMSIVIHTGVASDPTSISPKQACFPLSVSGIFPKPSPSAPE
jgi:hypothetical protein